MSERALEQRREEWDRIQKILDEKKAKEKEYPRSVAGQARMLPKRILKKLPCPYYISREWSAGGKLHRQVRFKTEADMELCTKMLIDAGVLKESDIQRTQRKEAKSR